MCRINICSTVGSTARAGAGVGAMVALFDKKYIPAALILFVSLFYFLFAGFAIATTLSSGLITLSYVAGAFHAVLAGTYIAQQMRYVFLAGIPAGSFALTVAAVHYPLLKQNNDQTLFQMMLIGITYCIAVAWILAIFVALGYGFTAPKKANGSGQTRVEDEETEETGDNIELIPQEEEKI